MDPTAVLTGPRAVLRPDLRVVEEWQRVLRCPHYCWDITVRGADIGWVLLRQSPDDPAWADYTIAITEPPRRGRGYGTEATRLVLAYAFARLDLAVVQLTVEASNRRAIACYRRCGFAAYTMERRLGQNHYGMLCANPDRYALPNEQIPPTLVVAGPTNQTITLRKAEAAFLGIGPGSRVAVDMDAEGAVVIAPAGEVV